MAHNLMQSGRSSAWLYLPNKSHSKNGNKSLTTFYGSGGGGVTRSPRGARASASTSSVRLAA
jgi:hypothetical protein